MEYLTLNFPLTAPVDQHWYWQGFPVCYHQGGTQGVPVVLIHGFGASRGHWRKNLPVLAADYRVYAVDLLGFGGSAKPQPGPREPGVRVSYDFGTWGEQVLAFCQEVIGEPAYLVGNSIGAIVALQAAVSGSAWVRGVVLLNPSLRQLHESKRARLPWYRRWSTALFQQVLGFRPVGGLFFARLARPQVVRRILNTCYGRSEAVTEELVELLLAPARDPGAVDVFLSFVRYSGGPVAEQLLPQLRCPAWMIWGEQDPWEPVVMGRVLAEVPTVKEFVALAGVGHCPHDEAPELVNPLLRRWLGEAT